tara:strand:+ start:651 stop:980 length:330 start_codon:yes stop_codon:yes gene_type:complete
MLQVDPLVHLFLRSQFLFFSAFYIALNSQAAAKTYEEKRIEFIQSFESIRSQVSEDLENQNKTRFCSLLKDYEKTLKDGWYFLRSSDYSYEELKESERFIYFKYQKNCL